MKKAFLIGIDYINCDPSVRLHGCIDDVLSTKQMLINDLGYEEQNITVLTDDQTNPSNQPSTMNIFNILKSHIEESANYDEYWFHYSGHGSQMADNNNEETDGQDEIIIPSTYATEGVINDDLLRLLFNQIKCKTMLVFDCCHSGSICDLPHQYRYTNNESDLVYCLIIVIATYSP